VAVRKQSMVPAGASVLGPAGTAPGLVVPGADDADAPVVVLPGPPWELQRLWPTAIEDPAVLRALARRSELRQATVRLWNTPESAIAETLRGLAGRLDGLEITTCLRSGELEVVTRFEPRAQPAYDGLVKAFMAAYGERVFSVDGSTVDDLVATGLQARDATVATAESCTAGLLAARLTEQSGSSQWVRGGLVVYSNAAKVDLAGVPVELLERVGAVSAEVALALAQGARARLGADVGVGITGIAGPGGATEGKPVGLVHLCVDAAWGRRAERVVLPGSRHDVRARSVGLAMHMLLTGSVALLVFGARITPGDLDVVPEDSAANLRRLGTLLGAVDAVPAHHPGWAPGLRIEHFDHMFVTRLGILDVPPQLTGTYAAVRRSLGLPAEPG